MARLLLLIATLIGCANAGPVTWYLHGVHYSEHEPGGIGVPGYSIGQFTYDADLNALTGWSITDLGDFLPWFPATFAFPGVPGCCTQSPTSITLSGPDSRDGRNDFLFLRLAQPLTDAGGTVQLLPVPNPNGGLTVGTFEIIKQGLGEDFRYMDEGGFVSTDGPSTTPEPSTLSGVLLGLICAGVRRLTRADCRSRLSRPNQARE